MTVRDFTDAIPRFAGLAHPEKIKLFAWFLHAHRGRDRFDGAEIGQCYDAAALVRPANLHTSLREQSERKPPILLRDGGGYRLELRARQALDARHGQARDQVAVSRIVADLIARMPNVAEKTFLQETVKCYSHGAFRAAIVMAWALAMDHVLEWTLRDAKRLADFNTRIPIRFPKKQLITIAKRDDFEDLKESEIIEVLSSANLISSGVTKVLREKLDKRNSAAHPSTVVFTQPQAEDVITDLINNVVLVLL